MSIRVDFPAPVSPLIPINLEFSKFKSKFSKITSLFSLYLKLIFLTLNYLFLKNFLLITFCTYFLKFIS